MQHIIGMSMIVLVAGVVSDLPAAEFSATYDNLNRLTNIRYPNGSRIIYSYDVAGNRTSYLATASESTTTENLALTNGVDQEVSISNPGPAGSSYEWYRDGIKFATTSEPRLPPALFSPAEAGAYRVIIREPGGAVSIIELTVQVKGLTYESWLKHKEGPSATPAEPGFARMDSVLSDGTENILKYAFGKGPNDSANQVLPQVIWTGADPTRRLAIRFRRILDPSDISIRVEASSNLSTWRDVTAELVPLGSPATSEDGVCEEVVLQCPFTLSQEESSNWQYLRVAVTDPTSGTPTVLLSDDFNDNSINAAKWSVSGNTVTESGQIMNVLSTVTDQWGTLTSKPIPQASSGGITITRDVRLHSQPHSWNGGTHFFMGATRLNFGNLAPVVIRYCNMDYEAPPNYKAVHGIFICRNNANPHNPNYAGYDPNDVSGWISPLWDTWFKETIVYNPQSGNLTYSINNVLQTTFNVGIMPVTASPSLILSFEPAAWWTGHEHLIDNLEVIQDQ